jgi:hypothetical protein
VAQVYVSAPPSAGEPPRQLKGFAKVSLAPGETRRVTIVLDQRAFSVWDTPTQRWVMAPGQHQVAVGDSSRNLSLSGPVTVPAPGANLALNRPATGSAACSANEMPAKAVNGSVSGGNSDKWCSASGTTKTLTVDLGAATTLKKLTVRHAGAGGEPASLNTRDFDLATSSDGTTWTTAAQIRGNTASVTDHTISATARWIRLSVIAGTQTTSNIARIYEFEAYA